MDSFSPLVGRQAIWQICRLTGTGMWSFYGRVPQRALRQIARLIAAAALVCSFWNSMIPGRALACGFWNTSLSERAFARGPWSSLIPGRALACAFWNLESGIWNALLPRCEADSDSPSQRAPGDDDPNSQDNPYHLRVRSNMVAVADADTSRLLYAKNPDKVTPIASITKLMTAIVTLEAKLPLDDVLTVNDEDVDELKGTRSLLSVGSRLTREDMLHVALMASENRAAACLSRYYPGGRPGFIEAMNHKALELGMDNTHFVSPNGLTPEDVSTALDLVKLVKAACQYPLIRHFSTDTKYDVFVGKTGKRRLRYINTNRLLGRPGWEIDLQKTGYISESGRCLVMQGRVDGRHLIMVFLDSYGRLTCFGDASRVRKQLALERKR